MDSITFYPAETMIPRRTILRSLVAAPAVIRTPGLLMPIKPLIERELPNFVRCLLPNADAATLLEFDRMLRLTWDKIKITPTSIQIVDAELQGLFR